MQALDRKDGSPADHEWQSTEDAKATVDKTPRQRDATDLAGDERERNDAGAGNQAEGDNPLVADRIDVGTNECNGDGEMSEGKPVGAISEEGIERVRVAESVVDAFDPLKQAS